MNSRNCGGKFSKKIGGFKIRKTKSSVPKNNLNNFCQYPVIGKCLTTEIVGIKPVSYHIYQNAHPFMCNFSVIHPVVSVIGNCFHFNFTFKRVYLLWEEIKSLLIKKCMINCMRIITIQSLDVIYLCDTKLKKCNIVMVRIMWNVKIIESYETMAYRMYKAVSNYIPYSITCIH